MNAEATSKVSRDVCFRRQYRLLAAAHYAETFAARRVINGAHFVLHYRINHQPCARLGLVIPKKQARRAVLRNAVKRQARELFRVSRAQLPAVDIVLRLTKPLDRPKQPGLAFNSIARARWRTEIAGLFERLGHKVAA